MLAVEIYLDPVSEVAVRAIWAGIDAQGMESLGSVTDTDYRPHVSLAVFGNADPAEVSAALTPVLQPSLGLPLTLASLGFFLADERVAFLAVTPTEHLLRVHRQLHAALYGLVSDVWPHYAPGTFVPHCTLAMRSHDAEAIVGAIRPDDLPITGVAQEIHLVEISTGRSRARLA